MAKYEAQISLALAGKPVENFRLCCDGEAAYRECNDAYNAMQAALLAFRKANSHDAVVRDAKVATTKVDIVADVTRDGAPHASQTTVLHDLPEKAAAHLKTLWTAFVGCPACVDCRVR